MIIAFCRRILSISLLFSRVEFLIRYFGPLKAESKKIHTSLVDCLRNHRGLQRKQQQKLEDSHHCDTDHLDLQQLQEAVDKDEDEYIRL